MVDYVQFLHNGCGQIKLVMVFLITVSGNTPERSGTRSNLLLWVWVKWRENRQSTICQSVAVIFSSQRPVCMYSEHLKEVDTVTLMAAAYPKLAANLTYECTQWVLVPSVRLHYTVRILPEFHQEMYSQSGMCRSVCCCMLSQIMDQFL